MFFVFFLFFGYTCVVKRGPNQAPLGSRPAALE